MEQIEFTEIIVMALKHFSINECLDVFMLDSFVFAHLGLCVSSKRKDEFDIKTKF